MFDALTENLGLFSTACAAAVRCPSAMSKPRWAIFERLLEADVALPVVRAFIDRVRPRAVGTEVLKSVTPGQQVVKIVNDELVDMLGAPHLWRWMRCRRSAS